MPAFTGIPAALYAAGHKLIDAELKTWYDALTALAGDWTAYTPSLAGVTLGNGSVFGRYMQVGKLVRFNAELVFGSTTTVPGFIAIGIPVTARDTVWCCPAWLFDNSNGANRQAGSGNGGTTQVQVFGSGIGGGGGGQAAAAVPFTWAVSDAIKISGTYEAA